MLARFNVDINRQYKLQLSAAVDRSKNCVEPYSASVLDDNRFLLVHKHNRDLHFAASPSNAQFSSLYVVPANKFKRNVMKTFKSSPNFYLVAIIRNKFFYVAVTNTGEHKLHGLDLMKTSDVSHYESLVEAEKWLAEKRQTLGSVRQPAKFTFA